MTIIILLVGKSDLKNLERIENGSFQKHALIVLKGKVIFLVRLTVITTNQVVDGG